jgi:hypothetical protein
MSQKAWYDYTTDDVLNVARGMGLEVERPRGAGDDEGTLLVIIRPRKYALRYEPEWTEWLEWDLTGPDFILGDTRFFSHESEFPGEKIGSNRQAIALLTHVKKYGA